MLLIDTHMHFSLDDSFNDILDIVNNAKENDVNYLIVGGTNLDDNKMNISIADKISNVYLAVGFHPSEASLVDDCDFSFLEDVIINNDKVVAIGEIGLDYHYGIDDKERQIFVFSRQLELAQMYDLPVVVHSRDATFDTINILKKYKVRGVIHCFSGSLETALEYIRMGFYLGIGGVITFSNSKLKDVIKNIDLSHIILETDSPYLSPFRGEKNEPKNVVVVANYLADLLNVPLLEVALITSRNANVLFDLKLDL